MVSPSNLSLHPSMSETLHRLQTESVLIPLLPSSSVYNKLHSKVFPTRLSTRSVTNRFHNGSNPHDRNIRSRVFKRCLRVHGMVRRYRPDVDRKHSHPSSERSDHAFGRVETRTRRRTRCSSCVPCRVLRRGRQLDRITCRVLPLACRRTSFNREVRKILPHHPDRS